MSAGGARPVYYLVGITGYPNYGDELIATTWLRHLAATAPESEVWLDCPHPGQAAAALAHLHPTVRFTDTLWRLSEDAPPGGPAGTAEFVRGAVDDPGGAARRAAGIDVLRRADVVHLIGGGYVNDVWPRNIGLMAGAAAAAARSGGRAVLTGQGLMPAAGGNGALLRELASAFELVDVRDEASAELLGDGLPVTCTGDDVLLDLGPHLYRSGDDLPDVMVCAQADLLGFPASALGSFVLDTLREWDVAPERVGFVEGIPGSDREVFGRIADRLPGARFYTFADLMAHGFPAAAGQHWLTTRFHPHLLAAAAGAAGVAVSIDRDYYATKHRSLIERGSRWALAVDLAVPALPEPGGFDPAVLRSARQAKEAVAAKIYP